MLYTIGHSNHPIDRFLGLLQQHGIQLLADVRSPPFSRFNPQFNRQKLQQSLAAAGIDYLFLGVNSARAAGPGSLRKRQNQLSQTRRGRNRSSADLRGCCRRPANKRRQ